MELALVVVVAALTAVALRPAPPPPVSPEVQAQAEENFQKFMATSQEVLDQGADTYHDIVDANKIMSMASELNWVERQIIKWESAETSPEREAKLEGFKLRKIELRAEFEAALERFGERRDSRSAI